MYMPFSLPSIFGKQPTKQTPAQAVAERAAADAERAQAKRAAAADVSAPKEPSPPAFARPTSKAPARGRVVVGNTMKVQAGIENCICSELFAEGSYKNAHKLECAIEYSSMCDSRLNEFKNDKYVALIQNIIYGNKEEPIEEQWGDVKKEIERQQSFVQDQVALDIKLVILQFKNKPALLKYEYIKNNEFDTKLYKRDYPADLEKVIMIMERMRLPVENFNALGLAQKLIESGIMSCDYKYNNTGQYDTETGATIDVLIDWDTKHQTILNEADKSNKIKLVSFMMLEYIMHLLILVYNASNDIRPAPETGIDAELENRINLFTHVRIQLKGYNTEIFSQKTEDAVGIITDVLSTAFDIFLKDEKGLTMLQNLVHYNLFKSLGKPQDDLDELLARLAGDIHKILQMEITYPLPHTMSIAKQIKTQYTLLTPKGSLGGTRKRPKTKRRRSHKKKKGTRKMFR